MLYWMRRMHGTRGKGLWERGLLHRGRGSDRERGESEGDRGHGRARGGDQGHGDREAASGQRVGFVHKIRGGDVGLPHGHKGAGEQEEGGEEVVGSAPGEGWAASGRTYTGEDRCRAIGCAACRTGRTRAVCKGCGGWQGRAEGAPPACGRRSARVRHAGG